MRLLKLQELAKCKELERSRHKSGGCMSNFWDYFYIHYIFKKKTLKYIIENYLLFLVMTSLSGTHSDNFTI